VVGVGITSEVGHGGEEIDSRERELGATNTACVGTTDLPNRMKMKALALLALQFAAMDVGRPPPTCPSRAGPGPLRSLG